MGVSWTIKLKLVVFAVFACLFVFGIGGVGYWGIEEVDHAMDEIVDTSTMLKDLLEADMMHDAIRADVLAAFVVAQRGDLSGAEKVSADFKGNADTFKARIESLGKLTDKNEKNKDLLATISKLKVALNDYIQVAADLLPLAFSNDSEAFKKLDGFEESFGVLLVVMEELSDSIHANVAISKRLGESVVTSSKSQMIVIAGLALLVLFAISFMVVRSITRGMSELMNAVGRVTKGDLRKTDKSTRTDEVGTLLNQFGEMTQTLSQLVSGIKDNAATVSSASQELSASSDQIKISTKESMEKASSVSSSSEEASRSVEAVSASTEEMSNTINEISQNIQEATRITTDAVTMAETTNSTMSKLGDSSAEIGNVIKVITAIAQQTNLLALNATIEAARAGEAGKGFAVVAHEVKDLAKATAKATEDIDQKITAIQADTGNAVTAIAEIERVIHKINEIAVNIAGAIEEQSATMGEITRTIAETATGASGIAKDIAGVAEASEMVAEGTENINAASRDLAKLGDGLVRMVAFFKVGVGLKRESEAQEERKSQEALHQEPIEAWNASL